MPLDLVIKKPSSARTRTSSCLTDRDTHCTNYVGIPAALPGLHDALLLLLHPSVTGHVTNN